MANWNNNFPSWGDTGASPGSGFQYDGGDQVNEKHIDYQWDQLNKTFDNILDHTIQDDGSVAWDHDTWQTGIDSGSSSLNLFKVNTSDELEFNPELRLGSDLTANGGETIWDESAGHVPLASLEASAVTVTAGDGLKGGGSITLGTSATVNIEPNDFAGTFLSDDGSDNLVVDIGSGLENDGSDNIRVNEDFDFTFTADVDFSAGFDVQGDITDGSQTIWDASAQTVGSGIVDTAAIQTDAVTATEIDLSISPTWTGNHTFNSVVDANQFDIDGSTVAQAVPASGQVTLSSGQAEVDTGITATDATFLPAMGIDDPNADVKVSARLFWDDSDGSYHVEFIETETTVGNPTVNYDIIRVR